MPADAEADRWAIAAVVAQYFRFIDQKRWEDFRGVFSDDAKFSHPTIGTYDDIDDAVAAVADRIGEMMTVHQGSIPEITMLSADAAEGIFPMNSNSLPDPSGDLVRTFGYYHDAFRRIDGEWKITSMKLESLYRGTGSR